jgi:hypothetical protein
LLWVYRQFPVKLLSESSANQVRWRETMNLRKFFLYTLIVSVAISALFGIGALLLGSFGDTEIKILLTTLTISCTSILGLACGAYFETGRGKVIPLGGIASAVISAALSLPIIWINQAASIGFVKTAFTGTIVAAACAHISLVSLARLDSRFTWSLWLVYVSDAALAGIFLYIIWFEPSGGSDTIWRIVGVLSIVSAAITIMTPVFHKLSRKAVAAEDIDAEIDALRARIEELERRKSSLV